MKQKQYQRQPQPVKPEPIWAEEWIPLENITQLDSLQPRCRLSPQHVHKYADMTKAGSIPPPIKVARVGEMLYLVDGWHRMEADALQLQTVDWCEHVCALVAEMSMVDLPWAAAAANMHHGKAYDFKEQRNVFKAFIKSKRHHLSKGVYMSYREMAAEVGIHKSTLHRWTKADFPALARALSIGGDEERTNRGGQPDIDPSSLMQEHRSEALKHLHAATNHAQGATPEDRWDLVLEMKKALVAIEAMGTNEPAF